MLKRLPVDISTFSVFQKLNYLYVDKTEYIYKMITGGRRFFLSRPRRFGKSLLVSTMKEILSNNKQLFDNLWIGQSDYQWQQYGIIDFDFSKLETDSLATLEIGLQHALMHIAQSYGIDLQAPSNQLSLLLENLARALMKRYGHVAILIDEYDSPILKTLHDEQLAKKIRDKIQQFFTTIKALDEQVQFVFITGVSSFAKAGLFSGINNLQILTLNKQFSGICGYTDQEVDHYFPQHIHAWAQEDDIPYDALRQQIKTWYNGYRFGNKALTVYNPFSLLNALHTHEFDNFWFQSGTPTFLVNLLKKESHPFNPLDFTATKDFLNIFDIGNIPIISLMFQAGYLTITDYDEDSKLYTLDYPNLEVRTTFQKYLLEIFAHIDSSAADQLSRQLHIALIDVKIDLAVELLQQLFAHVPYQLHAKEEKFYHALLIMVCVGAGIKSQSEYSTSHGRIDLIIDLPKVMYIIEIKFNQSAESALDQIIERRYYEQFIAQDKHIILLGLAFHRKPHDFTITYAFQQLT
jgi:hypothetical protein